MTSFGNAVPSCLASMADISLIAGGGASARTVHHEMMDCSFDVVNPTITKFPIRESPSPRSKNRLCHGTKMKCMRLICLDARAKFREQRIRSFRHPTASNLNQFFNQQPSTASHISSKPVCCFQRRLFSFLQRIVFISDRTCRPLQHQLTSQSHHQTQEIGSSVSRQLSSDLEFLSLLCAGFLSSFA